MFLERIAIFTLQVREKLNAFLNSLLKETDSQIGQLFFFCSLIILTAILIYAWMSPLIFCIQLGYSVVYIFCFLFCISGIHFIIERKRIKHTSNGMEVYTLTEIELEKFHTLNLRAIPLTEIQAQIIFNAFSEKHFTGTYESFKALTNLKPITKNNRLQWSDFSPKRPKQVNRQTLLEFLSQLLIGFENLKNQHMLELANHYFVLKNSDGFSQSLSTKNISDWKNNQSPYLKDISRIFQKHL